MRSFQGIVASSCVAVLSWCSEAPAQPLGAFSWQLQPFCNVLTFNVTQQAGTFTLDGFDDRCGAVTRASAAGVAFTNPDGTIGLGVVIVDSPGGEAFHFEAAISLATVSGTWRGTSGIRSAFSPFSISGAPKSSRREASTSRSPRASLLRRSNTCYPSW